MTVKPFLQWAGGKRWFIRNYSELFPKEYNRYIEPFLGAGSVFFHMNPQKAILGDINEELIETYKAIQKDYLAVFECLQIHQKFHSKDYYYYIRANIPDDPFMKAARIIYLNHTCWNGLYRVNKKGLFNVPFGNKKSIVFCKNSLQAVSEALKNATIYCKDFEQLIDLATTGDFLFIDSPYTVKYKDDSFVSYNDNIFSWDDQERLYNLLKEARYRGVFVIATNVYDQDIIDLYKNDFCYKMIERTLSINPSSIKIYRELLILS